MHFPYPVHNPNIYLADSYSFHCNSCFADNHFFKSHNKCVNDVTFSRSCVMVGSNLWDNFIVLKITFKFKFKKQLKWIRTDFQKRSQQR